MDGSSITKAIKNDKDTILGSSIPDIMNGSSPTIRKLIHFLFLIMNRPMYEYGSTKCNSLMAIHKWSIPDNYAVRNGTFLTITLSIHGFLKKCYP